MNTRVFVANGHHGTSAPRAVTRDELDEEKQRVEDMRPQPCSHPTQEPRYQTISNGARKPVMQCLGCGRRVRDVYRHETALRAEAQLTQDFDEDLREAGKQQHNDAWKTYNAERQRIFELGRDVLRSEYYDYRQTPAWDRRRKAILERDGHRCQARLDGCLDRATQAHHLTYDHRGNEPLFDLVAVCRPCHEEITRMDQEKCGA